MQINKKILEGATPTETKLLKQEAAELRTTLSSTAIDVSKAIFAMMDKIEALQGGA